MYPPLFNQPENLLLVEPRELCVKLGDFGIATTSETAVPQNHGTLGTLVYCAPEVVRREPYSFNVDNWSAGVVLYVLLSGKYPHYDRDQSKLASVVRKGKWEFWSPRWEVVSDSAKDLVSKLMQADPTMRIALVDALKHPWLVSVRGDGGDSTSNRQRLSFPTLLTPPYPLQVSEEDPCRLYRVQKGIRKFLAEESPARIHSDEARPLLRSTLKAAPQEPNALLALLSSANAHPT